MTNDLGKSTNLEQKSPRNLFFEKLWTVSDVAEYLRLPQKTIYAWVHQDRIPFLKLGNRLRFRGKAIEKWLYEKGSY